LPKRIGFIPGNCSQRVEHTASRHARAGRPARFAWVTTRTRCGCARHSALTRSRRAKNRRPAALCTPQQPFHQPPRRFGNLATWLSARCAPTSSAPPGAPASLNHPLRRVTASPPQSCHSAPARCSPSGARCAPGCRQARSPAAPHVDDSRDDGAPPGPAHRRDDPGAGRHRAAGAGAGQLGSSASAEGWAGTGRPGRGDRRGPGAACRPRSGRGGAS
jgi:hypothetical protein